MRECKYILAFRQYTMAIVSYNFFVKIESESHHKYHGQSERRLDYIRQYDEIGLEALNYFEKCLDSWPVVENEVALP